MPEDEIVKRALGAGSECPPIEALARDLRSPVDDPARQAGETHLRECLHCRTEMNLLREFEAGIVRPDEAEAVSWISARLAERAAPAPVAKSRLRWWSPQMMAWVGAAAAVLIIAGVSLQSNLTSRRRLPVPQFENEITRAQSIDIVENPTAFEWKLVSGAANYEIMVRLVDGSPIFHKIITNQTLAYPAEVAKTVDTGKLLLWEVIARDAAGNAIARSSVQRLRRVALPGGRSQ